MNMSEKLGRLGRGLYRVNLLSHDKENLWQSNVLPDNFFSSPKEGHDVTSHAIKVF